MTNLVALNLSSNQLTNLMLPADLIHLDFLNLAGNQFTSLTVPAGLTSLSEIVLVGNQLTDVTLPPDMTHLVKLDLAANSLETLVLSQPLAASTNLTATLDTLRTQGVAVFTYPLTVQLIRLRQLLGAFQFAITGPPGVYTVLGSSDLTTWSQVGAVSNGLGSIVFTDVTAHLAPQRFYRALLPSSPANMVFIPPNTFMVGKPE
jgi:hypothetical protein